MRKPRVVIIGGGPVGAGMAIDLASKGLYDVEIYEAYPHPATVETNSAIAYVLALGGRGQTAVKTTTGIDLTTDLPNGAVVSTHLGRHSKPRTNSNKSTNSAQQEETESNTNTNTNIKLRDHKSHPSVIVPRKVLTSYFLSKAVEAGATVHFEKILVDADFERKIVSVQTYVKQENGKRVATGNVTKVPYDLLVGADGSNSKVRELLHDHHHNNKFTPSNKTSTDSSESFRVVRSEKDSMEYQVVVLKPPTSSSTSQSPPSIFPTTPSDTVHVWNDKTYNSICLAFPLTGEHDKGSLLFAIVFPEGKLEEFRTQGYSHALSCLFPDLSTQTKLDIVAQLKQGEIANGGKCIWTNSLGCHRSSVVLVGDSGHGMWPSLGQGANCALESMAVFCETARDLQNLLSTQQQQQLTTTDGTPISSNVQDDNVAADAVLQKWSEQLIRGYSERRHKDVVAAVDLTYGGIGERQSRGRQNAPLSYKLRIGWTMLLHYLTAGLVPKPALLRIMMGEVVPYSLLHKYNFFYEPLICSVTGAMVVALLVRTFLF